MEWKEWIPTIATGVLTLGLCGGMIYRIPAEFAKYGPYHRWKREVCMDIGNERQLCDVDKDGIVDVITDRVVYSTDDRLEPHSRALFYDGSLEPELSKYFDFSQGKPFGDAIREEATRVFTHSKQLESLIKREEQ